MSALQVFQNIASAWRPGKSVIEVENRQVRWVSDGWNDLRGLVPTSHCQNATRKSILQTENEQKASWSMHAAAAGPNPEIISV